jgi:dTDP-4-amino-4,6-dideoxygalactose transaminase
MIAISSKTVDIPLFKPYIGPDTIEAATAALEMGWLGMGSYVHEFERELAAYLELPKERQLVAVNTCTSALHLALLAAGVGPGDEVLTPALNNVGDFQAIEMCGARPVFVDVREEDLGIDVEAAENLVGPEVKAVIGLHYMGVPCDIAGLYRFAARHGLRVIEDSAHAIGTRHEGNMIGSTGDLACFSFDAIKTLTCVDGGAVVTPTLEEAEPLIAARLMGMTQSVEALYANTRSGAYDVMAQGFRYHLANLHGAIGLSQLRRLPEFISNRRSYAKKYNDLLTSIDGLIVPSTDFDDVSVFHYVVRILDRRREDLATHLRQRGIENGVHWAPGNKFSLWKGCRGAGDLPVTDKVGDEIMTLPLWSFMEDGVVEQVAAGIKLFFEGP